MLYFLTAAVFLLWGVTIGFLLDERPPRPADETVVTCEWVIDGTTQQFKGRPSFPGLKCPASD